MEKIIYKNPPIILAKIDIQWRLNIGVVELNDKVENEVYAKLSQIINSPIGKTPIQEGTVSINDKEANIDTKIIGYEINFDNYKIAYTYNNFVFTVLSQYISFDTYKTILQQTFELCGAYLDKILSINIQVVNKFDNITKGDKECDFFKIPDTLLLGIKPKTIFYRYVLEDDKYIGNGISSAITVADAKPDNDLRSIVLDIIVKNTNELQCNECIDAIQKLKEIETKIFNDIITDKVKHIIK